LNRPLGPDELGPPLAFPSGEAPRDLIATAPALIAEVLSPSTERVDLADKATEYLQLESLAAYLVFAQDEMKSWVWVRSLDGFSPGPQIYAATHAVIPIAALGIELSLAEIYARVKIG